MHLLLLFHSVFFFSIQQAHGSLLFIGFLAWTLSMYSTAFTFCCLQLHAAGRTPTHVVGNLGTVPCVAVLSVRCSEEPGFLFLQICMDLRLPCAAWQSHGAHAPVTWSGVVVIAFRVGAGWFTLVHAFVTISICTSALYHQLLTQKHYKNVRHVLAVYA